MFPSLEREELIIQSNKNKKIYIVLIHVFRGHNFICMRVRVCVYARVCVYVYVCLKLGVRYYCVRSKYIRTTVNTDFTYIKVYLRTPIIYYNVRLPDMLCSPYRCLHAAVHRTTTSQVGITTITAV